MSVKITKIRHCWAEKAGFALTRPKGAQEYIMLHFLTPVELTFSASAAAALPGSLIVFAPGFAHSFQASKPLLHDWMHITGDVGRMMAEYGLAPNTLYQPNLQTAVSDLTAFLEMEFFAGHPYWPELSEVKLRELFIRVAHSLAQPQYPMTVRSETVDYLREMRSRILTEPWLAWSVAEMADAANISPSRLHAVYKAVFGTSPKHDLILMRMEKAKQLLRSGMRVAQTAEQLGYASVFHFIRQFRQTTGKTPKQYALDEL